MRNVFSLCTGYEASPGGVVCVDKDECADSSTHDCSQVCVNEYATYSCACNDGYRLNTVDGKSCSNIDECRLNHSQSKMKNFVNHYFNFVVFLH